MKIITKTIEVFYTEEELNNRTESKHKEELYKNGYKYKEGYYARVENEKGFIAIYEQAEELKIY